MNENDYIKLSELLAKLEVAIAKEFSDNNTECWNKRLSALSKNINGVRKNMFFYIDKKEETKDE